MKRREKEGEEDPGGGEIFWKTVGEREEEGESKEEDLDDRNLVGIYFLSL